MPITVVMICAAAACFYMHVNRKVKGWRQSDVTWSTWRHTWRGQLVETHGGRSGIGRCARQPTGQRLETNTHRSFQLLHSFNAHFVHCCLQNTLVCVHSHVMLISWWSRVYRVASKTSYEVYTRSSKNLKLKLDFFSRFESKRSTGMS